MELITIINKGTKWKTINLTCCEDKRLSWKAKGLHTYLASRPPDWEIRTSELGTRSIDGPTALSSGMKELISTGYVFRVTKENNGKILKWGIFALPWPHTPEQAKEALAEERPDFKIKYLPRNPKKGNDDNDSETHLVENPLSGKPLPLIDKEKNLKLVSKETNGSKQNVATNDAAEEPSGSKVKIRRRPLDCYPIASQLLSYWNSLGSPLTKHSPNPENKVFKKMAKNVEWLIKNDFTAPDIIKSMETYHWLLNLEGSKLALYSYGVKVSFGEFIKFEKRTADHLKTVKTSLPLKDVRSWFEECLLSRDTLEEKWSTMVPDDYPAITKTLKQGWLESGGRIPLTIDDENIFRRLSKKAYNYFEALEGVSFIQGERYPISKVHHLFDALKIVRGVNFKEAHPTWLASDRFFEETLPIYWSKMGMRGQFDPADEPNYKVYEDPDRKMRQEYKEQKDRGDAQLGCED